MQRATGGMRGFPRGPSGSVKARLGVQPGFVGRRNAGVVGAGIRTGGIQRRLGGGVGPAMTGVKARLGGNAAAKAKRSVASVAISEILDARQKINLNRVQSGRIGDARQKIEEKRRKNSLMDGKVKNLRIVAPVSVVRQSPLRSQALMSRTERQTMGYEGVFRSAMEDTFNYNLRPSPPQPRITRSISGYPMGMRIAPPSEDEFLLTRTIRNPTAGYGGGMRSDYEGRSPRVAPSVQYGSHGSYSRSALREHAMDMDEDDYDRPLPPRRPEYPGSSDSQSRILVSNLQPSVTADDIVELFSDIGSLIGARMTASGQAEVTYSRKSDALKAIEAYHNRLLDGSAMRVFLDSSPAIRGSTSNGSSYTALKSASGASMKLPAVKPSSGIKIQPDISAIHKVLFNPGSSATRGLFKGGQ